MPHSYPTGAGNNGSDMSMPVYKRNNDTTDLP